MSEVKPTLEALRGEIDRLDDELVDLLIARARLVAEIGPLKTAEGAPILRPGREADILRRCLGRAAGGFDTVALARIWREIVAAALRQQGPFSVAVYAPDDRPDCWGLARGHFGAPTRMTGHGGAASVLGAVADGAATVGVVPFPEIDDAFAWWPRLMRPGAPRIVARLPAIADLAPPVGCRVALCVALMTPEPSERDTTFVAFECEPGLSRARLSSIFERARLERRFAAIAEGAGDNGRDCHLAELPGFLNDDAEELSRLADALGDALGDDAGELGVIGAAADMDGAP